MAQELSALARWVTETSQRIVILFEGRDTAGKGGSIEMFAESQPAPMPHCRAARARRARAHAMVFPALRRASAGGRRDRAVRPQLVQPGRGREGDGLLHARQTQASSTPRPEFERHLVDDGILLLKYWLCCDQAVQEERFENRLNNPMKRWKLSPIDIKARAHYDDYTEAREVMLAATHTDYAPWTLVDFNDQPLGRLTLLRDLLDRVPDTELPLADIPWPPLDHKPLKERFGVLRPIPSYPVVDRQPRSRASSRRSSRRHETIGMHPRRGARRGESNACIEIAGPADRLLSGHRHVIWIAVKIWPRLSRLSADRRGRTADHPAGQERAAGTDAIRAAHVGNMGQSLFWLVVAIIGALLASLPVSWVYMAVRSGERI